MSLSTTKVNYVVLTGLNWELWALCKLRLATIYIEDKKKETQNKIRYQGRLLEDEGKERKMSKIIKRVINQLKYLEKTGTIKISGQITIHTRPKTKIKRNHEII